MKSQREIAEKFLQESALVNAYEWSDGEVARAGLCPSTGDVLWVIGQGDRQVVIGKTTMEDRVFGIKGAFKVLKGDVGRRERQPKLLGLCCSMRSDSLLLSYGMAIEQGSNRLFFPTFEKDHVFDDPIWINGNTTKAWMVFGPCQTRKRQIGRNKFLFLVRSAWGIKVEGTCLKRIFLEMFERHSIHRESQQNAWMASKSNIDMGKFIPDGEFFEAIGEVHPLTSGDAGVRARWIREQVEAQGQDK